MTGRVHAHANVYDGVLRATIHVWRMREPFEEKSQMIVSASVAVGSTDLNDLDLVHLFLSACHSQLELEHQELREDWHKFD